MTSVNIYFITTYSLKWVTLHNPNDFIPKQNLDSDICKQLSESKNLELGCFIISHVELPQCATWTVLVIIINFSLMSCFKIIYTIITLLNIARLPFCTKNAAI